MMKEYRDQELGALLNEADDAPQAPPGFEERVWRRIAADADQTTAAAVGAAVLPRPRTARRRTLLAATMVSTAAAAAILVIILFGLPGAGHETGPAPVSAAEVSARMTAAMSSFRTLQGTMKFRSYPDNLYGFSGVFFTDAAGSFSLRYNVDSFSRSQSKRLSEPLIQTYNAQRHVALDTYVDPTGRRESYGWDQSLPYEGVGVPGWITPYPQGPAWLVRAALIDGDPRVKVTDTVFGGRPAWKVALPAGDIFIVDARSGFLVQWSTPPDPSNPDSATTSTLSDLRVDQPLPAEAFSVAVPRGSTLVSEERNSYYCRLGQVAARVGFRPFVPSHVPSGYRLSDVATDPRQADDFLGWQGPDPGTHDPHTEEFLRYRHGADSFTVHVASIAHISRSEVAGYFRGLDGFLTAASARLDGGSFAGYTAHTWFAVDGANLLVVGKSYVAYLSGSLTRQELYEVASSLQQ
jgi:hypothetical protein